MRAKRRQGVVNTKPETTGTAPEPYKPRPLDIERGHRHGDMMARPCQQNSFAFYMAEYKFYSARESFLRTRGLPYEAETAKRKELLKKMMEGYPEP